MEFHTRKRAPTVRIYGLTHSQENRLVKPWLSELADLHRRYRPSINPSLTGSSLKNNLELGGSEFPLCPN